MELCAEGDDHRGGGQDLVHTMDGASDFSGYKLKLQREEAHYLSVNERTICPRHVFGVLQ